MRKNRSRDYQNRITKYTKLYNKKKRIYSLISLFRIFSILTGILLYIFFNKHDSSTPAVLTIFISCSLFILALIKHKNIDRQVQKLNILININKESLKRLEDTWSSFPVKGEEFLSSTKSYLSDLNIFGHNSLFQMIQSTATKTGRKMLADLFIDCNDFSNIKGRQNAIKEMSSILSFRQHLLTEGRLTGKSLNPEPFIRWTKSPSFLLNKKWLVTTQRILVFTTIIFYLVHNTLLPNPYWLFSLALQFVVFALTASRVKSHYIQALSRESSFTAYGKMFSLIEKDRFKSEYLRSLQERLRLSKTPLSLKMAQLEKINHLLSICYSSLHPFLNIIFLWDIHFLSRLEAWKEEMRDHMEEFFKILGLFESISSLAGFSYDNPDCIFPEISYDSPPLMAEDLGHPLIPSGERVKNDLAIQKKGSLILITGSNMSGKSTFIRTVGINLILAFAGAPVAAGKFTAMPCRIITCIQSFDSLNLHISHFYAEVKGIKNILDQISLTVESKNALSVLYLIDEIFSGTNTRERLLASKGIILRLASSSAYGFLTTHDLDLVKLENDSDHICNYHFSDYINDKGEMAFDYKIKKGSVTSTNALKILELAGIKIGQEQSPNACK